MPHMHIEYSRNVENVADIGALCRAVHDAIVTCGVFPLAGSRTRAFAADHAIVADGHEDAAFVAMTLSVGAGRTTQVLKEAGDTIFAAAREALAEPLATDQFSLSLEIRVMDPDLAWKETTLYQRLAAKDG